MRVVGSDDIKALRRERKIVEKTGLIPVKPGKNGVDPRQKQNELIERLIAAVNALSAKETPAPIVNIPPANITVDVPETKFTMPQPPKGWKFKARKDGDEWTIEATRVV